MRKRLAIVGSKDLGRLIAYYAVHSCDYDVVGYYDDFAIEGDIQYSTPILGKLSSIKSDYQQGKFDYLMIGIGYNHMMKRKEVFDSFKNIIPFANIIHPSSYIDKSVKLGDGILIHPNCTIDAHSELRDNVVLNAGVVVAHDSKIGSHCFLSPSVNIAGKTIIEECCIIGINSTIIDNIVIGSNIRLGAGAVVINNLEKSGLYVGVPAKLKREFK